MVPALVDAPNDEIAAKVNTRAAKKRRFAITRTLTSMKADASGVNALNARWRLYAVYPAFDIQAT